LLMPQDNERTTPVAVIDEQLASRYFPKSDPLGKHIHLYSLGQAVEIVGVVGHVKQFGLATDTTNSLQAQVYVPMMQTPDNQLVGSTQANLVLRTSLSATAAEAAIRTAVQTISRDYVVFGTETMDEVLARSLAARQFSM